MANKQPTKLEPGIYFDLPEDEYHNDPALSNSGMVSILVSLRDYYDTSPLNHDRPERKTTDAMLFGNQCHQYLLQNDKFYSTYNVTGQKYDPKKKMINRTDYEKIVKAINIIREKPEINAYFTGGMPEVTLVWDDPTTGIRLRARVDYLRTFGCIDYKRTKSILGNSIGFSVYQYGYDMQCAVYKRGMDEVKRLINSGKATIQGEVKRAWIDRFAADESSMFVFLFQRTTPPNVFTIKYFDDEIMSNAEVCVNAAIDRYKSAIEQYGTDEPWPFGSVEPEELSSFMMPKATFTRGVDQ
jgi:hypothetical protein